MTNQLATISALIQSGNSESVPLDLSNLKPLAIYLNAAGSGTLATFASPFLELSAPNGDDCAPLAVLDGGMDVQIQLGVGYNLLPAWIEAVRVVQFAYLDESGDPVPQTADVRFWIVGEIRR